jgi:hypothetical protein
MKYERHELYVNPNASHGWQVTVRFHNEGPAVARAVYVWVADEGGEPTGHSYDPRFART